MTNDTPHDSGWRDIEPENDFAALWGPIRKRRIGDRWVYGLEVRSQHRNGAGVLHGGAIMALFDEVVGTIVAEETGRRNVTVQHSSTFLRPAHVGDFVEVACEIVSRSRSMTFVEAKLCVAGEAIAMASFIFKAVKPSAT